MLEHGQGDQSVSAVDTVCLARDEAGLDMPRQEGCDGCGRVWAIEKRWSTLFL